MKKLFSVVGVVGAYALATVAASLTSVGGASDARQDVAPPTPRPFDPRTDRLGKDSTPELNIVGRLGVVIPDLGAQRAKHPPGSSPVSAEGGTSDARQDLAPPRPFDLRTDPPPPPPIDPRNPRFIMDTTPHLNLVGQAGAVIPDLGKQRAQHPPGSQ